MNNGENKSIHIQLTGENAHPENIPLPKLVSIIESYVKLIGSVNIALRNGNEFSMKEFSLTSISACCTDIVLAVESEEQYLANEMMVNSFQQNHGNNLPDFVKEKANQLTYELNGIDLTLSLFNSSGLNIAYTPELFAIEDVIVLERRTIYGEIINIGGKRPNFHVEDHTGKVFVIDDISAKDATKIAPRLYANVGVVVDCHVHIPSMEIENRCKFIELLPFDDRNWLVDTKEFLQNVPSFFSSTDEMSKRLTEIRQGKTNDA